MYRYCIDYVKDNFASYWSS